jgi:hypothetical protein
MPPLTRSKALIFRITHIANVPWILANGMHCRSSNVFDPNYRNIGNPELIDKRSRRVVQIDPGGTLSDYVPFYFTSRSPMLLNIKTGRNVTAVPMSDIVVLATSLPKLVRDGIPFIFSDRHAYLNAARFSNDIEDLDRIDWQILAESSFGYDANDPGKMDRYQAEALVHRHLPISAVGGILCYSESRSHEVRQLVAAAGHTTSVLTKPSYFF